MGWAQHLLSKLKMTAQHSLGTDRSWELCIHEYGPGPALACQTQTDGPTFFTNWQANKSINLPDSFWPSPLWILFLSCSTLSRVACFLFL